MPSRANGQGTSLACVACCNRHSRLLFELDGVGEVLECANPRCSLVFLADKPEESEIFQGHYPLDTLYLPLASLYRSKAIADLRRLEPYSHVAGKLLDVGCGVGYFVKAAQEKGWEAWGIEPNREAATFASQHGIPRVLHGTLAQHISRNLPLLSDFDVVTLFGVIEHVVDPAALLIQIAEVLRPGGLIVLHTPNQHGLFRWVGRAMYSIGRGNLQFQVRETISAGHLFHFSQDSISQLLERLSFEVVAIEGYVNPLSILLKRYDREPLIRRLTMTAGVSGLFQLSSLLNMPNHILAVARI